MFVGLAGCIEGLDWRSRSLCKIVPCKSGGLYSTACNKKA